MHKIYQGKKYYWTTGSKVLHEKFFYENHENIEIGKIGSIFYNTQQLLVEQILIAADPGRNLCYLSVFSVATFNNCWQVFPFPDRLRLDQKMAYFYVIDKVLKCGQKYLYI